MAAIAEQLLNGLDDFDVVGLQEVWMQKDYDYLVSALRSKYPYSVTSHSGAIGSGLVTFSKYPIEYVYFKRYRAVGRPEHILLGYWFAGKGVAITRVRHPSGRIISILNTHTIASYNKTIDGPDCYETQRSMQAYDYAKIMEEESRYSEHVIGLGDFNMQPSSFGYRAFLRSKDLQSAFELEPTTFNNADNTYRKSGAPGQAIDHILYTRGLEATKGRLAMTAKIPIYNYSLSDHHGIAADFEFIDTSRVDYERSNSTERSGLLMAVREKVNGKIGMLEEELSSSYQLSVLCMLISIALLTWFFFLSAPQEAPRHRPYLKLIAVFTASTLFFTIGFIQLFTGFAFVNEELATHRQFLLELNYNGLL